jgi:predicted transcriptional regulator
MFQERAKFELYLELLTQVKYGNCNEASLMKCTNLSRGALHLVLDPLLSERLLKNVKTKRKGGRVVYHLTDKGDQFIDFLELGLEYTERKSEVHSDWIEQD